MNRRTPYSIGLSLSAFMFAITTCSLALAQNPFYLKDDIQYFLPAKNSRHVDMKSPFEKMVNDQSDAFHSFKNNKLDDKSINIVFETMFITVDEKHARDLYKYFVKGSVEITKPGLPVMQISEQKDSNGQELSAQSLSTKSKSKPCAYGLVSAASAAELVLATKGDTRTNISQAPTVRAFDQQIASICNFAQRPFVVGSKPIVIDGKNCIQPIVQIHADGVACKLSAKVEGDQVDFRVTCYQSQITDVETFTFAGDAKDRQETVQIPVITIDQFRAAKKVKSGEAMMIDFADHISKDRVEKMPAWAHPIITRYAYVGNFIPKKAEIETKKQRVFLLITPRIVPTEK